MGLGNPGRRYERTRHNVGFEAVDRLVAVAEGRWNHATSSAIAADVRLEGYPLTLLKPLTYMNLSGEPVRDWVEELAISRSRVLVYYDDVALPLGRLRLRGSGSSGGHRGLASILEALGGEDVPRMRIGIRPEEDSDRDSGLADFVLSEFDREERETVDAALDRVVAATRAILNDGLARAQSLYNAAGSTGR